MTAFVCANCVRAESTPAQANRGRPADFGWPGNVRQVVVPCTGRLQPENILRAFESGSSIVSVVACREDNCHYIEGSRRCAHRMDYIRSILKEIGLGDERLLLFHLPGSASEDLALSAGKPAAPYSPDLPAYLTEIRDQAVHELRVQSRNPLAQWHGGSSGLSRTGTEDDQDE